MSKIPRRSDAGFTVTGVISKGFAILPMPKSRLRRTLRE
jgi:hypothetical protein